MRIILALLLYFFMVAPVHADVYLSIMSWGGLGNGGPIFQYLKIDKPTREQALGECRALATYTVRILSKEFSRPLRDNKQHVACVESIEAPSNSVIIQTHN